LTLQGCVERRHKKKSQVWPNNRRQAWTQHERAGGISRVPGLDLHPPEKFVLRLFNYSHTE
jgi:hypothetical protein